MPDGEDQAMADMLKAGWSSIGRKKSKSGITATTKAPSSAATGDAASEAAADTPKNDESDWRSLLGDAPKKVASSGVLTKTASSESVGAKKKLGLGSWSRLLSRDSVSEAPAAAPEPAPEEAPAATEETPAESSAAEVPAASTDGDDEEIEVDLSTFLKSSWKKAGTPAAASTTTAAVAEEVAEEVVEEFPEEFADEAAEVADEAADEGGEATGEEATNEMDALAALAAEELAAEEDGEAGEVDETILAEEEGGEEAGEEAGEESMEAGDGDAGDEAGEDGGAAAADSGPADVVDLLDSDDENTAGQEFRDALDEMPDGKLMASRPCVGKAKAAIPKQPTGPPPNAKAGIQASAKAGVAKAGKGKAGGKAGGVILPIGKAGNAGAQLNRTISGNKGKGKYEGNSPKAGIIPKAGQPIVPLARNNSGSGPLARTNSGNSPQSPGLVTKISGGQIIRTASGNIAPVAFNPGAKAGSIQPGIQRGNSHGGSIQPGIQRGNSFQGKGNKPGVIQPGVIQPGIQQGIQPGGIKRGNFAGKGGEPKRTRTDTGPIAAKDAEGRQYDLTTVVVNFANVGASYAKKVLKRENAGDRMMFDWEGIRKCVNYLTKNLGLKVIGVINENFYGTDNHNSKKVEMPADIKRACHSVEETPRIVGKNHSSADDEMTIKCAYHRNCRFLDNDNYRDWKQQMRDDKQRAWLTNCQDLLHMRYYFDSSIGVFETLDGNVPAGLLAPDGCRIPANVSKQQLWSLPNR